MRETDQGEVKECAVVTSGKSEIRSQEMIKSKCVSRDKGVITAPVVSGSSSIPFTRVGQEEVV